MYLPITTRQLADGTVEITPSGEIDLDNAHVMRDAVNDVLTTSTPGSIVLDLRRVMLIDSIGIGILVACFHAAAASGVRLAVSHPSPTERRTVMSCIQPHVDHRQDGRSPTDVRGDGGSAQPRRPTRPETQSWRYTVGLGWLTTSFTPLAAAVWKQATRMPMLSINITR